MLPMLGQPADAQQRVSGKRSALQRYRFGGLAVVEGLQTQAVPAEKRASPQVVVDSGSARSQTPRHKVLMQAATSRRALFDSPATVRSSLQRSSLAEAHPSTRPIAPPHVSSPQHASTCG